MAWQNNFTVLPNKILPAHLRREGTVSNSDQFNILFVGVLSYGPNFTGLDRFIGHVWPNVIARYPQTTLKVVGRGLPTGYKEKWEQVEGIKLYGFVENIDEAYAGAHISISPTYSGSGTHIKVMESLLRSTTMVITKTAHRGYEDTLLDGESLYVVDNDDEYAEKICHLIKNPDVRVRMGQTGSKRVLSHHTIKDGQNDFLNIIQLQNNNPSKSVETTLGSVLGRQEEIL